MSSHGGFGHWSSVNPSKFQCKHSFCQIWVTDIQNWKLTMKNRIDLCDVRHDGESHNECCADYIKLDLPHCQDLVLHASSQEELRTLPRSTNHNPAARISNNVTWDPYSPLLGVQKSIKSAPQGQKRYGSLDSPGATHPLLEFVLSQHLHLPAI